MVRSEAKLLMKYGFGTFAVRKAFAAVFRVSLAVPVLLRQVVAADAHRQPVVERAGVGDLDAEVRQQLPLERHAPALLARVLRAGRSRWSRSRRARELTPSASPTIGSQRVPSARTGNGSKLALPVAGVAHLNVRPRSSEIVEVVVTL